MHTPSCYTPPVSPLAMPPRTSHLHPQRTKVAVSSPAADGVQIPAHAVCESCRPAPLNNTSYCAAVETGLGQLAVALQARPSSGTGMCGCSRIARDCEALLYHQLCIAQVASLRRL